MAQVAALTRASHKRLKEGQNYRHVLYVPPEKWKGKGSAAFSVVYDDNNKLLNIQSPSEYEHLYPDQITKEDLLSPEDREIGEKLNHIKK